MTILPLLEILSFLCSTAADSVCVILYLRRNTRLRRGGINIGLQNEMRLDVCLLRATYLTMPPTSLVSFLLFSPHFSFSPLCVTNQIKTLSGVFRGQLKRANVLMSLTLFCWANPQFFISNPYYTGPAHLATPTPPTLVGPSARRPRRLILEVGGTRFRTSQGDNTSSHQDGVPLPCLLYHWHSCRDAVGIHH